MHDTELPVLKARKLTKFFHDTPTPKVIGNITLNFLPLTYSE